MRVGFAITQGHESATAVPSSVVGFGSVGGADLLGHAVSLSPLTLAASKGSFECMRELLWGGALADEPSEKGLVAKQFLQSGTPGFMALNLLIRCHAFGQREGKIKPKSEVPHRVLLIDTFVDPAHPDYADHHWFNHAERDGAPGVDDDKNGFTNHISGWKSKEATGESI